jgi:hypothetical protein
MKNYLSHGRPEATRNLRKEVNTMKMFVKSIAILVMLSSCAFFAPSIVGAQPFGFGTPQVPEKSQQTVLSSPQGRFAFGQVSDSSEDKFMLDTFTGRLWRLSKRTDIGICLTAVPYRSEEGECSPLPEKIPDSGSSSGTSK